jgi:glycosyltransferase involved in cell wall biosynthesis
MRTVSRPHPPRLGYLLRTFPVLSETFVTGEIRTVAGLTGQAPVVAALYRPGPGQGGQWEGQEGLVRYWPDIDKRRLGELALAHAALWAKSPARSAEAVLRPGPEGLNLKDRIKAPYLARFFLGNGVGHMHGHFAWENADMLAHLHRLTGLPYSLTLHAADIFLDQEHLERRLAKASFVATISQYNRRLLDQRVNLPPGKVHVVHCGVDLPSHAPKPLPETWPARVVSLGRMVPKKGFDVLLKALALLRADGLVFEADLVGDGPMRPELESLAYTLGLGDQVRFHGALAPAEALARLECGRVFALACRVGPDGDMDGIPVALMEAMALGRPVVSTRLSGIPELVDEGCGLLAEPGDAESLASQIRRLLMDRDLSRNLAVAGRGQVEKSFTLRAQAQGIMDLAWGRPTGEA